jgi:transposase
MATLLVPDELWSMVEALLPAPKPRPKSGRPPLDNHAAPTGIIFVLKSGIPWEMLPQEMGCGMTCWRRLRDWQAAGIATPARNPARAAARSRQDRLEPSLAGQRLGAAKRGAAPPGRARAIAANRAPSALSWSTAGAPRSASC